MENIYWFIVLILFVLAISDLIVGVSNDAVNFLNSAIGSKAAPFKVIMVIAALGILVGATFSSGMMEVARKGIFHPNNFYFSEIMIIFLSVMITDIILLDLFNTMGLPTSTTVSIVFELLGGAVGMALIKLKRDTAGVYQMADFINTDQALLIIFGILLSVVVAFTVGAIVQYLSRLIFSFNYEKILKYFGSIWGALAITAITHFMLIKGAKDASFMTDTASTWIKENSMLVLLYSFLGWAVILQILTMLFKINILKIIVLVGTFALAMAFAGNDLVNFIGVPLAGFASYEAFSATAGATPDSFSMGALQAKVQTPTYFLLAAGAIMVATLWLSKKAKSVVKTSIDLSRQDEGTERFESSYLARSIVRGFVNLSKSISTVLPDKFIEAIGKRFDNKKQQKVLKEKGVAFDLIRASVNLVVASILIAFATSKKLPLSTTYVTFMVAMGTSLADGAWGRESAVYRISGVVTVIGGWFFTAFIAFTVSFVIANIINLGGIYAIVALLIIALIFIVRTHHIHKIKLKQEVAKEKKTKHDFVNSSVVYQNSKELLIQTIKEIEEIYSNSVEGLLHEKLKSTKKAVKSNKKLAEKILSERKEMYQSINEIKDNTLDMGVYIFQIFDYLKELTIAMDTIVIPVYEHIDNNHTPLSKIQNDRLKIYHKKMNNFFSQCLKIVEKGNFDKKEDLRLLRTEIKAMNTEFKTEHIKSLNKNGLGKKSSLLFLDILATSKVTISILNSLVLAQEKFIKSKSIKLKSKF